ncbi:hypothetical protein C8R45DRAFT_635794 [Mycena sanguinolenta]|nr:hypothetical protein C8R45DRAFT_635794 [Mycena sanguinolenta]
MECDNMNSAASLIYRSRNENTTHATPRHNDVDGNHRRELESVVACVIFATMGNPSFQPCPFLRLMLSVVGNNWNLGTVIQFLLSDGRLYRRLSMSAGISNFLWVRDGDWESMICVVPLPCLPSAGFLIYFVCSVPRRTPKLQGTPELRLTSSFGPRCSMFLANLNPQRSKFVPSLGGCQWFLPKLVQGTCYSGVGSKISRTLPFALVHFLRILYTTARPPNPRNEAHRRSS